MRKIASKILEFFKNSVSVDADPYNINKDWDDFKEMDAGRLRQEFSLLMAKSATSDRFRRLCHFIALQWVYRSIEEDRHENVRKGDK